MERRPNFVCIGAQRAGSTWLYENLKAHAGIWLPPIKELHYFDELRVQPFWCKRYKSHLGGRIRNARASLRHGGWSMAGFMWDAKFLCLPRSDRWYASLFSPADKLAAGEITPAYSTLSADTVAAIKRINPDMKIIFVMRDPIERSWSQARKDLPRVYGKPLDEIPAQDVIGWFNSHWCLTRSDYLATLKNWLAHFPRDQLFVGFHEEIIAHPKDLLLRLFELLGVEKSEKHISANLKQAVNAATEVGLAPIYEYELPKIYEPRLARLEGMFAPYPERWHQRCVKILHQQRGSGGLASVNN